MNPKILLVEDLELNRTFFIKFLARKGLSCDVAVNGQEAVRACGKQNYDIIFMDCQMPVMDGYEATKRIRAIEAEKRHAVIIAMTACAMEDDRNRCLEAGMDDYLNKPFKFEELMVIIEKYGRSLNEIDKNTTETDYFSETLALFMKETGFDEETSVELLNNFCEHAKNLLYEIQENINNNKPERARVLLHQLKGSSGSMRVKRMLKLAFEAETALGAADIDKLKTILEGLKRILDALNEKEKHKK